VNHGQAPSLLDGGAGLSRGKKEPPKASTSDLRIEPHESTTTLLTLYILKRSMAGFQRKYLRKLLCYPMEESNFQLMMVRTGWGLDESIQWLCITKLKHETLA
jgi:hypothetical protein